MTGMTTHQSAACELPWYGELWRKASPRWSAGWIVFRCAGDQVGAAHHVDGQALGHREHLVVGGEDAAGEVACGVEDRGARRPEQRVHHRPHDALEAVVEQAELQRRARPRGGLLSTRSSPSAELGRHGRRRDVDEQRTVRARSTAAHASITTVVTGDSTITGPLTPFPARACERGTTRVLDAADLAGRWRVAGSRPSGRLRPGCGAFRAGAVRRAQRACRPPRDDLDGRVRVADGEEFLVCLVEGLARGRLDARPRSEAVDDAAGPRSPRPDAGIEPRPRTHIADVTASAPGSSTEALAPPRAGRRAWRRPGRDRSRRSTSPPCARSPSAGRRGARRWRRAPLRPRGCTTGGRSRAAGRCRRVETGATTAADHRRRSRGSMPWISVISSIARHHPLDGQFEDGGRGCWRRQARAAVRRLARAPLRASSASSDISPPEEVVGVDVAEHDAGVGDGRARRRRGRSTPGPGRRRRSAGPTCSRPPSSTHAMRAAARTDRAHVDGREAGDVSVGRVPDERLARPRDAAAADQARRRRSCRPRRSRSRCRIRRRAVRSADRRPGRRPARSRSSGSALGDLAASSTPPTDVMISSRPPKPALAKRSLELPEELRHQWLERCVDRGGRRAAVLAQTRVQGVGERDRELGQVLVRAARRPDARARD